MNHTFNLTILSNNAKEINMNTKQFSKEYIFNECESNRHCLGLELNRPILLDDKQFYQIYVLHIEPNNKDEEELLIKNCALQIDSYGKLNVLAFVDGLDVQNAKIIEIDTSDIIEVYKVKH